MKQGLQKRLPMIIFILLYLLTGYIGAIMMLFGPEQLWSWYVYFSGVTMPSITYGDLTRIMILLHVPPILMWMGYEVSIHFMDRRKLLVDSRDTHPGLDQRLIQVLYFLSLVVAAYSLIRTGSFRNLSAWADYNQMIQARYQLFNSLNFFEFVNIYTVIPVIGTLLILTFLQQSISARSKIVYGMIIFAPIIAVNILIYQKKPLITSMLIIIVAIVLFYLFGKQPRVTVTRKMRTYIGSSVGLVVAIYLLLILLPVISSSSQVYQASEETKQTYQTNESKQGKTSAKSHRSGGKKKPQTGTNDVTTVGEQDEEETPVIFREFGDSLPNSKSRLQNLILYTLMAPISRTSAQSIAYPIVFPTEHQYYPVDMGQDIIGFGLMPDDNVVVWNTLYPDSPGGSVAAPFHIILYSQGGLWVSIIGSLIVGIALGFIWMILISRREMNPLASVLGSLLVMLSIYVSIDALRNSVTVSYGLLWPVIAVIAIAIVNQAMKRMRL